jgi:hypothetical protein
MPLFFDPKTLSGILMGGAICEKFRVPGFFFFWKKILVPGFTEKMFWALSARSIGKIPIGIPLAS